MIRLHVVVEGQTEETFVNRVLAPDLWSQQIIPDAHRITTGRRRSRVFRGGLASYQQLKNDLILWMKEDQNPDAYFTTMVDLYRLPKDFPGYDDCRVLTDPHRKVGCLESALKADLNHRRFIPYIQVHEFESLLFADPGKFVHAFPGRTDLVRELEEIRGRFPSPEHIDEGDETAPSKLIASLLPEYPGAKTVAGPLVASHIGMARLRRDCAHFDLWVRQLEGCAPMAPSRPA